MTAYRKPSALVTRVLNPVMEFAVGRFGLGGKRVLEVRSRKSGEWRGVPVNLLVVESVRYLVAPRGETQWVRNLRAAGEGRLKARGRIEEFTAIEASGDEKPPILRAYLDRWAREARSLFDAEPGAPEEELRKISPDHPVFRLQFERR